MFQLLLEQSSYTWLSGLKIKTSLEKILAKKTEKKYVDLVGLTPAEIQAIFQKTDAHLLEQCPY